MRTFIPFCCFWLLLAPLTWAQVPRQVVVEHFTNTRCGVCAFRNPGFYANLEAHPEVLNLAIHPSSPYSSCVLNQHNSSENDARTNHYGIYGGTPRVVVQGEVVASGADYGSADIFAPYLDQTSPFEVRVREVRDGSDSVTVEVTVYSRGLAPIDELRLTVVYLEDTVFYAAPNGENEHYGVLRAGLTDMSGELISVPLLLDSTRFTYRVGLRSEWDPSRMQAMALLSDPNTLAILQAGQTTQILSESTTTIAPPSGDGFSFYPNPSRDQVILYNIQAPVSLLDAQGRQLQTLPATAQRQVLEVGSLPAGLYWLRHGSRGYLLQVK